MLYRTIILLIGLVLLHTSIVIPQSSNETFGKLISSEWLKQNLDDPNLIILHYGLKEDFEKEHIPNARLISIRELIVNKEEGLHHELPDVEILQSAITSWGINDNSKIVICYPDENMFPVVARLYFTLDYAGLGDVTSILNGGFPKWIDEDLPVTSEVVNFEPCNFKIKINENILAQKEWIIDNLNNRNVVVVDARPEGQYSGDEEDHNSPRQGHIQRAVNIPFYNIMNDESPSLIKEKSELYKLFRENYIAENGVLVVYCGSGIWAAPIYFAARYLGYNVLFYDGSYQEWGNDYSLPVTGPVDLDN
ncbi:sulfurtransferase [Bacteroidota bacterium]